MEEIILTRHCEGDDLRLVAVASWAPAPASVQLAIDFPRLGLDPAKAHFYAPRIAGMQGEVLFEPGAPLPVAPGRGWLLVLDEQARQSG